MEQDPEKRVSTLSPDTLRSLDALEKFTLPVTEHFTIALHNDDKWVRYLAAELLGILEIPGQSSPETCSGMIKTRICGFFLPCP